MNKVIGYILILFTGQFVWAQADFDLNFETVDKIVGGGGDAWFSGGYELDEAGFKDFTYAAINIDLPDDWTFALCTPDICAPDGVDTMYFENDAEDSSGYLSVKIATSDNPESTFGELDLKLIDNETGAAVVKHFTATISLVGIEVSEKSTVQTWLNTTTKQLYISGADDIQHFAIVSLSGQIVFEANELTTNKLDVSWLPQGLYFIRIETNKNLFSERFIVE